MYFLKQEDKDNNEPHVHSSYSVYSSSESSSSSVGDDTNDNFHTHEKTQTFIPMKDYQQWVKARSNGEQITRGGDANHSYFSHEGWASDSNSLTYSLSDATSTRESGLSSKDSTSVGLNPYIDIQGTRNVFVDNAAWVNAWKVRSPGKVKRGHYPRDLSRSLRSLESVKEQSCADRIDNEEYIHEDVIVMSSIFSNDDIKATIDPNKSSNRMKNSTVPVQPETLRQKIESTSIENKEQEIFVTQQSLLDTNLAETLQPSALPLLPERNTFINVTKKYSESQLQEHDDDIYATNEHMERFSHSSYSTTSLEPSGCLGDDKSCKILGKQFLTRLKERSYLYQSCDDESFFSVRGYNSHSSRKRYEKRCINRRGWIDKVWSPESDLDLNIRTHKNRTTNDVSSKMSNGSYENIDIIKPEPSLMMKNIDQSVKEQFREEDSVFDMSDDASISSFLTKESDTIVQSSINNNILTADCQEAYVRSKQLPKANGLDRKYAEIKLRTGSSPKPRMVYTLNNTFEGPGQTASSKKLIKVESNTGSPQQIRIVSSKKILLEGSIC